MRVVRDLAELTDLVRRLRASGRTVGLVPTMGALHEGHLELLRTAADGADIPIVSIFVNPLQFGPGEDLDRYPRDEEGDLARLARTGCELIWMPPVGAMYPSGGTTRIEVGGPAQGFEGADRPGHFQGVATVCAKLFHQTCADLAVFGEKDWQQLQVIRRMVRDLDMSVRILACPTVREADGLACSSRNGRLAPAERALAAFLPRTMLAALRELGAGRPPAPVLDRALDDLRQAGLAPHYLALVEPESLRPWPDRQAGTARLLAAATIGGVRLIDNMAAVLPGR